MRIPSSLLRAVAVAASSLVVTASASGVPFTALVVDTGSVMGSMGQEVTPSSGYFYLATRSHWAPPSSGESVHDPLRDVTSFPSLGGSPEYGVEPFMYRGSPVFWSGRTRNLSPRMSALWFSQAVPATNPFRQNREVTPPAHSMPGPLGPDSVFIARLVVTRGSTIQGPNVEIGAKIGGNAYVARVAIDGESKLLYSTASKRYNEISSRALTVRSHLALRADVPGFGPVDVYDLYIVSEELPPILPASKPSATASKARSTAQSPGRIRTWEIDFPPVAKAKAKSKPKKGAVNFTPIVDIPVVETHGTVGSTIKSTSDTPMVVQVLKNMGT